MISTNALVPSFSIGSRRFKMPPELCWSAVSTLTAQLATISNATQP